MSLPWSITTTVRNPIRNRDFLKTISEFEGLEFNEEIQIKFQIRLIEKRFYKPNKIPPECQALVASNSKIDYENAKKIFEFNNYEDPPMRGRQSANPLSKLGFAVARENFDKIIITTLGKKFLEEDYDINYIFLKSLIKIQFPNPWSKDFSKKKGFNLNPFISTLHLINKINKKSKIKGLTQAEFSIFVPTLNKFDSIDDQVKNIISYRKETNKRSFVKDFAKKFYKKKELKEKKISNLFDYGDNIMRYFRLTNYFKVSKSHILGEWRIDLEPTKKEEINQIIKEFKGEPINFSDENSYLKYLSDINLPKLPWENKDNLIKIIKSYNNNLNEILKKNKLKIKKFDKNLNKTKFTSNNSKEDLLSIKDKYINVHRKIKNFINFGKMKYDLKKLNEKIEFLENSKKINSNQFKPEMFEKLFVDIFIILNDSKKIKPNYPMDEDGEPLSHASSNKPDFECYYNNFNIVGEVTKQQGGNQWMTETVPPQKHLSDFEDKNKDKPNFLLFLAPTIHERTYANFFIAIKGGAYGKQKIIPLSTTQFSSLLKKINIFISKNKKFNSDMLKNFFEDMINLAEKSERATDWSTYINEAVKNYKINEN
jgi:hypothetical protein